MKIRVRYFAAVREALGEQEWLELPEGATVGDARAALTERDADHARALRLECNVRAAHNQVMCNELERLSEGSELAFFPPVTGG